MPKTIRELADEFGVSKQAVSLVEGGISIHCMN
jgi:transcriptional regulator with XRE-family HTH domain